MKSLGPAKTQAQLCIELAAQQWDAITPWELEALVELLEEHPDAASIKDGGVVIELAYGNRFKELLRKQSEVST